MSDRSGLATAGASALALLLAAALPLGLHAWGRERDLGVWVSGNGPYQIATESAPLPSVHGFPSKLLPRVSRNDGPHLDGSGLWLRSQTLTFGAQWEQQVTVPFFRGPFVSAESPVCGYRLGISEGVLSTPEVRALAFQQVSAQWSQVRTLAARENVSVGELKSFSFDAKLAPPGLLIDVAVEDASGAGLSARLAFRIQAGAGRLVVSAAAPPTVTVTARLAGLARAEGGRRADDSGVLASAFFGDYARGQAEAQLRGLAAAKAVEIADFVARLATGQLARLARFPSPLPGRSADTLSLIVPEQPTIADGRLSIPLCLQAQVAAPGAVEGPGEIVHRGAAPPLLPAADATSPRVELAMNGDALNQVLFVLWRTGTLREAGGGVLGSARESEQVGQLLRQLDFDIKHVDPALPPVLADGDTSRVHLTAAGVRLGSRPGDTGTDLVVHAEALASVETDGDDVVLRGDLVERTPGAFGLSANCVRGDRGVWTLTSCVGDLLPIARLEWSKHRATHPPPELRYSVGSMFRAIAKSGLVSGLTLDGSRPHLETRGRTLGLDGRIDLALGPARSPSP